MDHTTMLDEIKFLINKYVEQEQKKVHEETHEAQKNMEVLEQLPLVMSLRRRIRHLETELRVYKEGPNVYLNVQESLQQKSDIPKTIHISNSSSNIQELDNTVVNDAHVIEETSDIASDIQSLNNCHDFLEKDLDEDELNKLTPFYKNLYLNNKTSLSNNSEDTKENEVKLTKQEEEEEE